MTNVTKDSQIEARFGLIKNAMKIPNRIPVNFVTKAFHIVLIYPFINVLTQVSTIKIEITPVLNISNYCFLLQAKDLTSVDFAHFPQSVEQI